jgi:hypothetical protein
MIQRCDLCKKKIPEGTKYGVLVFNIEMMEKNVVDVLRSETVHTMCMKCASQFNNRTIVQLID